MTLLVPSCEAVEPGVVGEGKHLRFRVRARRPRRRLGDRVRPRRRSSTGSAADGPAPSATTSSAALKENRWNGTVAPQLVVRRLFDAPDGYEELRAHLAKLWRAGEAAWTSDARAIFTELELAEGARRQLYESEAFRTLLAGAAEALPEAA